MRQGGIGARAREAHRPAHDGDLRRVRQFVSAMRAQAQQEGRQQVLERETAAEHARLLEQRARGMALERLDEPRLQRLLDIGLDRPRPRLDHAGGRIVGGSVEAQGRTEGDDGLAIAGRLESGEMRAAVCVQGRDDGVGGAEIDPDRGAARGHSDPPPRLMASSRSNTAGHRYTEHLSQREREGPSAAGRVRGSGVGGLSDFT